MPAAVQMRTFPIRLIVVLIALIVALLLAATLGYSLKAPTVVSGSTRVVFIHDSQNSSTAADYGCIVVQQHKAC